MSENKTDTLKDWLIILAFIFILTLVSVVWLFLFSDFAFFNAKVLEFSQRIDYGTKVLTTTGTIFGGLAVLINAYYAAKRWEAMDKSAMAANESAKAALKNAEAAIQNAKAAQDKQITERFAKATEQLGSEKIEVRLGAIYTLERIAKDSKDDHWTVMEVLTAFVRENAPLPTKNVEFLINTWLNNSKVIETQQELKICTDIQAALTVIGRRTCAYDPPNNGGLDLRNTSIVGANIKEANLQRAIFREANLQKADLYKVDLQIADLNKVNLQWAILIKANLQKAELGDANLFKCSLNKANLQGAYLAKANLQQAYLTEANLQGAALWSANLQGANLREANLKQTDLERANLEWADFKSAKLQKANFSGSSLKKANLLGANLSKAKNLEQWQIDSAKGDRTTILPDYLEYPTHWQ